MAISKYGVYCVFSPVKSELWPFARVSIWTPTDDGPKYVRDATALSVEWIRLMDVPDSIIKIHYDTDRRRGDRWLSALNAKFGNAKRKFTNRSFITVVVFLI